MEAAHAASSECLDRRDAEVASGGGGAPPLPLPVPSPPPAWLAEWGVTVPALTAALHRPVAVLRPRGDPILLPQSAVAVVDVEFEGDAAPPASLLAKHADVGALRAAVAKSEAKWAVTVRSYDNEAAFMTHGGPLIAAAREHGCAIPAPVLVRTQDAGTPRARYTTCLHYLPSPPWYQRVVLDATHAAALLRALAGFHAAAWDAGAADAGSAPLHSHLFPSGAWWRAELRPSVDFSRAPAALRHMVAAFPAAFASFDTPAMAAAMGWLAAHEPLTSAWVSAPGARRTLVHGDPKASNVLFTAGDDGAVSAALVDFQWCGGARSGAADVVYVLVGAVAAPDLRSSCAALVEGYWHALTRALPARAAASYPYAAFVRDMNLELLDYAKTALPQLHFDMTPAAIAVTAGTPGWLVHETDPGAAAWMFAAIARVVAALAPSAPTTPADLDAATAMRPFWVE